MGLTVENIGPPIDGTSIGAWVKAATIAVAEAALREEVGRGFDTEPTVITDGVIRRDYHDVRPFGRIEFTSRFNLADAVFWTMEQLFNASPVKTGRYRQSHMLVLNNQLVSGNIRVALAKVTPSDTVMVVNTQPYAGKIEGRDAYSRWETRQTKKRGKSRMAARKKAGYSRSQLQGESSQARNGVYRVVLAKLIEKYGKAAAIDYRPVTLPGGVKVWTSAGGRSRKRVQKDQLYPAFIFKLWLH
jgi:hypothetical protein